jgi:hypothetical protein
VRRHEGDLRRCDRSQSLSIGAPSYTDESVAPSPHCLIGAQQRPRRTIMDENSGNAGGRSRVTLSTVSSQAIFMADDDAPLSQKAARRHAG